MWITGMLLAFGYSMTLYLCYQDFQFRIHRREIPDLFRPFSGFPFGRDKVWFEMLFVKFEPGMSLLLKSLLIIHRMVWAAAILCGVVLLVKWVFTPQ
jgi:hypothetical protein